MAKLKERADVAEAMSQNLGGLEAIARRESERRADAGEPRKKKLVTFFMPRGEYDAMKRMFGANGLSVSAGVRMCVDYVSFLKGCGKVVFTSSGIHEDELLKL